ncbi:MAG: DegV family protein [Chloroflexi bacterium]|jgi:DegV family protein with EDD domain|nr:DegV family protein [Chloroflexota bacterium]MBT7080321.1 DegV family protein [Chloroflexota bacterium]MBT7289380.1 DegV family protein [Chloroflexota bacterium]
MANVLVMTDTVACIPPKFAKELNIKIVPAALINIADRTYIDGVDLSAQEAYAQLQKDPDSFSTSQITPKYLLDKYRELGKEPLDVLFITLSSALSAVIQSAKLAAEEYKKEAPDVNIMVLDSKAVAGTQGLVVLAAARAAANGKPLDEIAIIATKAREVTGGLVMLDTLKYVYRTGRMSKTKARIISFFNIRPINRINEAGEIVMVDKTRKREKGLNKLLELIGQESETDSLHFAISHSAALATAQGFAEQIKAKYNALSITISDYSPVMGYGAGPGCIFVGFQPELDFAQ